jgi:hypothetical protein
MLTLRSTFTRRLAAALDASPSRIPVLLGGCGMGRTTILRQLRDRIDHSDRSAQYIDVERAATTPERFLRAITTSSPFPPFPPQEPAASGARAAFDRTLALFDRARAVGNMPATFLLDEFLELRTFESFPGLRQVLHELVERLSASPNRFVLTSRYSARTLRLLRDHSARFEIIPMPPLTAEDTLDILGLGGLENPIGSGDANEAQHVARIVQSLADGRPVYVRALADQLSSMRDQGAPGSADAVSALVALLAPEGRLARQCGFCYELRLHRARGYGALKAILEILADEEGLTLTTISQRLQRTPGSTKDYLSWLEDVDLVTSHQKRYRFTDPILRVWVRLHCRPTAPSDADVSREVQQYAIPRLPHPEPDMALVPATVGAGEEEKKPWGIIEID